MPGLQGPFSILSLLKFLKYRTPFWTRSQSESQVAPRRANPFVSLENTAFQGFHLFLGVSRQLSLKARNVRGSVLSQVPRFGTEFSNSQNLRNSVSSKTETKTALLKPQTIGPKLGHARTCEASFSWWFRRSASVSPNPRSFSDPKTPKTSYQKRFTCASSKNQK